MNRGLAQYRNVQSQTTDPRSLLLLLFDKTLQQLDLAAAELTHPSQPDQHRKPLVKAHLGVLELDRSLNNQVLPQLAESLHCLYMHILLQLGTALGENDLTSLRRAEELLGQLRGTWKQAFLLEQSREEPRARAV